MSEKTRIETEIIKTVKVEGIVELQGMSEKTRIETLVPVAVCSIVTLLQGMSEKTRIETFLTTFQPSLTLRCKVCPKKQGLKLS